MMRWLVTFMLTDQEYGLDVQDVQEVLRMVSYTNLPEAPVEIIGAINVRGTPTLVLDARQRFGLPPGEPRSDSPLLLVRVRGLLLALLVDSVVGVVHTDSAPDRAGIIRIGNRLVLVLAPDALPTEAMQPLLGASNSPVGTP